MLHTIEIYFLLFISTLIYKIWQHWQHNIEKPLFSVVSPFPNPLHF